MKEMKRMTGWEGQGGMEGGYEGHGLRQGSDVCTFGSGGNNEHTNPWTTPWEKSREGQLASGTEFAQMFCSCRISHMLFLTPDIYALLAFTFCQFEFPLLSQALLMSEWLFCWWPFVRSWCLSEDLKQGRLNRGT